MVSTTKETVSTAKETKFPEPIDVRTPLTKDELDILKREYQKAEKLGLVPVQIKFNLAWSVIYGSVIAHIISVINIIIVFLLYWYSTLMLAIQGSCKEHG